MQWWKMVLLNKNVFEQNTVKYQFYCATVAYHVGVNAVLRWPQVSWPTSKKNRHL